MDKQVISTFRFDNYKIDSMQYIINKDFIFTAPINIEFDIKAEIRFQKESNNGTVTLHANVFENETEKNYPFSLSVVITGYFSADGEMPKESFMEYCKLSGTAALFPFLRSAIADITRIAGVEPLILPLINVPLYLEQKSQSMS